MQEKVCYYTIKCKKYKEGNCPLTSSSDAVCLKLYKINKLQELALLSEKQREHVPLRLDSDKCDKDAFEKLKEIETRIESFIRNGDNLYIYSANTGNGKSSWALRLLSSYFEKIWYSSDLRCRGLFINIPKFLISLKENISQKSDYIQHIKDNVLKADLVIWDDVATKGFTTFEMENVLNLINNRLDDGKSNIYTSNLIGEELRGAVGDRLYSRMIGLSEVITFVGKDKRGLKY
jgi:DNA replication protein DnaC